MDMVRSDDRDADVWVRRVHAEPGRAAVIVVRQAEGIAQQSSYPLVSSVPCSDGGLAGPAARAAAAAALGVAQPFGQTRLRGGDPETRTSAPEQGR